MLSVAGHRRRRRPYVIERPEKDKFIIEASGRPAQRPDIYRCICLQVK
jgi:hypothetical protein